MGTNYFHTLGRNTISNFLFFFVNNFFNIVSYAILIRYLTLEDYGMLIFTTAFLGQFAFLDGGLSTALEKFIPEFRVKNEHEKINQSIIASLGFFFLIGCLISIFLIIVLLFDGLDWFSVTNIEEASWFLVVAVFFSPFTWIIKGLDGALKGFNKYHEVNIYDTSIQFFSISGSILIAILGGTALWIFLLQQSFVLIKGIIYWFNLRKLYSLNILGVTIRDLISIFKFIFSYSFWVLVMRLSGMLVNQFDKIIVSTLLGLKSLPIYLGIIQIIKILSAINGKLKGAIIPIASEVSLKFNEKTFNEIAYKGLKTMNAIANPIPVIAILFSPLILKLIGKNYLLEYSWIFQVGTLIYLLAGSRAFLHSMHTGAGRIIKFLALFSVVTSVSYIGLCLYLINSFNLSGAIIALPLTHLLSYPIWAKYVLKETNMPFSKFVMSIFEGMWPSLLVIILFFILQHWTSHIFFSGILFFILIYLSWNYTLEVRIKEIVRVKTINLISFILNKKS